jgi:hypothetical protein
MGPVALAADLGVSPGEARELGDSFMAALPRLAAWLQVREGGGEEGGREGGVSGL